MKKAKPQKKKRPTIDRMRPEYNFAGGSRGKYARRVAEGSNLVLLDPDVARAFPDSKSVNMALRTLAGIARKQVKSRRRSAP
ncbi:MAG TPA: hypothetical protein VMN39_00600 [Longimicrobiaceae bacterium]|nr:hypothetical protein [Longimicrobiaceae bacterium]